MIAQTSAVNTDAESGNLMEITVFDGNIIAQATAFPSAPTQSRFLRAQWVGVRPLHPLLYY